jgi:type VI secretion system ImpM family protein
MPMFGSGKSATPRLSCFGKLPTYGDFLSVNVDGADAEAFVSWLQAGVAAIPTALTPATDQFLHFVWSPAGSKQALFGVIWPSADSAGRKFPFALFVGVPSAASSRHGVRRLVAAETAWRRLHEIRAQATASSKLADQYAVLQQAWVPEPPDVRDVNRAFVERAQAPIYRPEDGPPLGLHMKDLVHYAESLGGARQLPDFALRMKLHGAVDPDVEASTWMQILADRLGVSDVGLAAFLRMSRAEGQSIVLFQRGLQPSDLPFLLAPHDGYRFADHLGWRGVPANSADTGWLESFNRAWSNGAGACLTLLEIGSHGWKPGEMATGPVCAVIPSIPAAVSIAPALDDDSTGEIPPISVETIQTAAPRTADVTLATSAAPVEPSVTDELVARIRRLVADGVLPGRVVRVPAAAVGAAGPEVAFYWEDGRATVPLVASPPAAVMDLQRQADAHVEVVRLLDAVSRLHRETEDDLRRALAEACARARRPGSAAEQPTS